MHDERNPQRDTVRLTAHEGQSQEDEQAIRAEAWGPIADALEHALTLPLPPEERAGLLAAHRAAASIVGRRPMRLA
jgi:hypothetical protein